MKNNILFEQFINGKLSLPNNEISFGSIPWSKHPTFEGVELKHIITSKDTNNLF